MLDWATRYLEFAEVRFVCNVFKEKKVIFQRFLKFVDPAMTVDKLEISKTMSYFEIQKRERSGHASNKDRKYLLAAWNWGVKYMEGFPKTKVSPFLTEKMPEIRHPRYVPPEKDFWAVYDQAEGQDELMLLTYLHTAARRGELFKLRWADVHFDVEEISLFTRKTRDGSMKERRLPMTDELYNALFEHKQNATTEWVFPNPETGVAYVDRKRIMEGLCKRAGVKPFGFHAIRHLTPSILSSLGAAPKVIQAVMGHEKFSTTERYLHRLTDVKAALKLLPFRRKVLPEVLPVLPEIAKGLTVAS
ncbi:MAG: site-specific integrase [Pseudomonadota bacterium]